MPILATDDGVNLHYEEVGSGTPIVFVHEFAGDCRSWEAQMRYFGRRYRCIAFNARGYPPSDVPDNVAQYSQDRARDDIKAVLDALKSYGQMGGRAYVNMMGARPQAVGNGMTDLRFRGRRGRACDRRHGLGLGPGFLRRSGHRVVHDGGDQRQSEQEYRPPHGFFHGASSMLVIVG